MEGLTIETMKTAINALRKTGRFSTDIFLLEDKYKEFVEETMDWNKDGMAGVSYIGKVKIYGIRIHEVKTKDLPEYHEDVQKMLKEGAVHTDKEGAILMERPLLYKEAKDAEGDSDEV